MHYHVQVSVKAQVKGSLAMFLLHGTHWFTEALKTLESYSPQLLPSSPGYRRAQLPVLRMHIMSRLMTGKMPIRWLSSNSALRWLSPNGFTTLKTSDNHYIHLRKTFYLKMYQSKIQGYAPDFLGAAKQLQKSQLAGSWLASHPPPRAARCTLTTWIFRQPLQQILQATLTSALQWLTCQQGPSSLAGSWHAYDCTGCSSFSTD